MINVKNHIPYLFSVVSRTELTTLLVFFAMLVSSVSFYTISTALIQSITIPDPDTVSVTPTPQKSAGAALPITYDTSSIVGTAHYVATTGSDAKGSGRAASPFATLAKAYSASQPGDTIVMRGGTYRQGNVTILPSKQVTITAYSGEIPVFVGSKVASDEWKTEGSLRHQPYSPMPVTNGSGIDFISGQNLSGDSVGKYPDQVWAKELQLRQVTNKGSVTDGSFYVDRSTNRVYVTANTATKGDVEVSDLRNFINIQAPGTKLEGVKVTRFSNSAADYGVVKINETADSASIRNVEITDSSFIAMSIFGNSNLNKDTTLKNVTVSRSNWMGVSATYTDNLALDEVYLKDMNQWDEFTYSPQSGALKTSRTYYTKVINSQIRNNKSHGIWFDQSNYDVQIAGNVITDNSGSAVFFEISDKLLMVNNYVRTAEGGDRAVKLAGSSGLQLINNTIIGGADPVGIYVDSRSKPDCANPSKPLCANSYGSDRDTVRPYRASMDWVPRLDVMINNIIVYPTRAGYCGATTALCITGSNGSAQVPIHTVIHKGSPGRQPTQIDGNVYANGTDIAISTPIGRYATPAAFSTAMDKARVGTGGLETSSLHGNTYVQRDGTPTPELSALHSRAVSIPTDTVVNRYISSGTRHYGVLFK